jgi:hypothetical protein
MALSYIGEIEVVLRTVSVVAKDLGSGTVPQTVHFHRRMASKGAYGDTKGVENGTPVTYDLRGGVTDLEGTAISQANVALIFIRNKSTTTGQYLTIGAGSNPITTLWGASGDSAIVGPDSVGLFASTVDGFATTAGTGDVLTITSAAGTIQFDIIVWWL